jgi:methylmalonyl-CoA mutase
MMNKNDHLFSEFQVTSKSQWLARIEKDLKGRPISDLYWQLTNTTQGSEASIIDPFPHAEDFKGRFPEPLVGKMSTNTWAIVENIPVKNKDYKAANKQALKALMGGVNALHFIFETDPNALQMAMLFNDIELDYISVQFSLPSKHKSPLPFLKIFVDLATEKNVNLKLLRGGINFDPFIEKRYTFKAINSLLLWKNDNLPLFKTLTIDGGLFFKGSDNVIAELGQILLAGENYVKKLTKTGIESSLIAQSIQFYVHIDTFYFIEIAKIRAFKILWANVLAAYNTPSFATLTVADIHAIIAPNPQDEDSNTNKIRATTQAMSAVLGGISSLNIASSDVKNSENEDFNRRIARNIQHLLQMESYLDRVADPAAGSFYIEQLTTQIAEATWSYFQAT